MHAALDDSTASTPANPSRAPAMECKPGASFVLHFESLFHAGREFAFPCDEQGSVDLDTMPTRIRNNYLYARAMLGREFAWPSVRCMSVIGFDHPHEQALANRCVDAMRGDA